MRLKLCPLTFDTQYVLQTQRGLQMINALDTVVLMEDLPEYALKQGDIGTVVLVHDLAGYEVEFMTLNGETLAVVSLMPHQVVLMQAIHELGIESRFTERT